jgi:uncharacterized protein (DUF4415 family)
MSRRKSAIDRALDAGATVTLPADYVDVVAQRSSGHVDVATTARYYARRRKPAKEMISIRLSPAALDVLRATGPGWQTRLASSIEEIARRRARRDRAT